ncbi:MAG: ATP-binding cassette domain-containing protein [Chelatococcus sp.]|uniref:ABC transporter ATP-binding protein n=1 Tax=Chelatococcus sp. TaxID=1953771 RepID=UPI0025BE0728|nr:ATP-binding cassette domain-containing protein [Chelatococcus sp.]MBX3537495.1 ATP-binding cassette domain-containing protein [Chelatococcus sp.]
MAIHDLCLNGVEMSFPGLAAPVLSIASLRIEAGTRVAIAGASGSGKSTFVNLVTGLERASKGRISWNSTDLGALSHSERDRWRGETIGLVMQDFHLFPGLSALDNVLLPARLAFALTPKHTQRARDLLERAGLKQPQQRIETMSRGEMQRVAVARALLRKPSIIVADEPTASLDEDNGKAVGDLIFELAAAEKSTLITVSHDKRLIARFERRIEFANGRIAADTAQG